MEQTQDKVTRHKRLELIYHGVKDGTTMDYMAEQIEMAYIAGANRLDLSRPGVPSDLKDNGEILTAARTYVKDKGYKI